MGYVVVVVHFPVQYAGFIPLVQILTVYTSYSVKFVYGGKEMRKCPSGVAIDDSKLTCPDPVTLEDTCNNWAEVQPH